MAAGCTYHLHNLDVQQEPYKKSVTLNEKRFRVFWREKKSQKNGPLAEKWQDKKRARRLGRKKWEETGKGESNDSPEIPDRGKKSDSSRLPSGDTLQTLLKTRQQK